MAEPIVFYPKYTTLVEGTYYSDPYEVTPYKSLSVEVFNAAAITSGTITGTLQESSDLETWTDITTSLAPSAGASATDDFSDTVRYVRLKIVIGATGGVVTFWAKAVARES